MATHYPDVIPMIAYEDGPKAMDWLTSAFGFKERARMLSKDGRLSHGEMLAGAGVIMLATPTPDYQAPRRHRAECEPAQRWSTVPYIVDGVRLGGRHRCCSLACRRHSSDAKSADLWNILDQGPSAASRLLRPPLLSRLER